MNEEKCIREHHTIDISDVIMNGEPLHHVVMTTQCRHHINSCCVAMTTYRHRPRCHTNRFPCLIMHAAWVMSMLSPAALIEYAYIIVSKSLFCPSSVGKRQKRNIRLYIKCTTTLIRVVMAIMSCASNDL